MEIICHPMMERKKIDMKEKRKRRIYFFSPNRLSTDIYILAGISLGVIWYLETNKFDDMTVFYGGTFAFVFSITLVLFLRFIENK